MVAGRQTNEMETGMVASVQLIPAGKATASSQGEDGSTGQGGDGFSLLLSLLDGSGAVPLNEEASDAGLQGDLNIAAEALVSAQALFLNVAPVTGETPKTQLVIPTEGVVEGEQATPLLPLAVQQQPTGKIRENAAALVGVEGETVEAPTGQENGKQENAEAKTPVAPVAAKPDVVVEDSEPTQKENIAQSKTPVETVAAPIADSAPVKPEAAPTEGKQADQKKTKALVTENAAASLVQDAPQAAPTEVATTQAAVPVAQQPATPTTPATPAALANPATPATEQSAAVPATAATPANPATPQAPVAQTPSADADASADGQQQNAKNQQAPVAANSNKPATVPDAPTPQATSQQAAVPAQAPVQQSAATHAGNAAPVGQATPEAVVVNDFNSSQSGTQQQNQAPIQQLVIQPTQTQAGNAAGQEADFARHLQQATTPSPAEQVQVQFRKLQSDGSSKIEIKLEPVELGKVEIKLHVSSDGKTGVHVTTDTRAALEALQRDVRGLERALADAGLKTDSGSLNFSLRGEQQDQQAKRYNNPYGKKSEPEEELEPIGAVVSQTLSVTVDNSLDISI